MKIGLNSYIWTLSDMKNWKKHQKHKFTKPLFAPYLQKLCLYDQKWHWLLGSLFKVLNPDNKRRSDNVLWPFSERSGPSDNVQWTFIERSWLSGKQLIKNWNFLQQKKCFCHIDPMPYLKIFTHRYILFGMLAQFDIYRPRPYTQKDAIWLISPPDNILL